MKQAIILGGLLLAQPVQAQMTLPVDQLNRQDVRLATLADRMFAANASLCRNHMPLTGLIMHSRDQYGAAEAKLRLGDARVGVAVVLPGSPAEQSGIRPGDAIVAIGGVASANLQPEGEDLLRDAAFALLADGGQMVLARDGSELSPQIKAPAGCRGMVEVRAGRGRTARTDGRIIQIDYALVTTVDDQALAVIFAHEFAHLVLEHRRRLQAAGVSRGFFAQLGQDGKMSRQMEEEADLLSVHLLANAGFDPAIAPLFWRSDQGRQMAGGLMRSRTHPAANARAEALEREINNHLQGAGHSSPTHLLALRGD